MSQDRAPSAPAVHPVPTARGNPAPFLRRKAVKIAAVLIVLVLSLAYGSKYTYGADGLPTMSIKLATSSVSLSAGSQLIVTLTLSNPGPGTIRLVAPERMAGFEIYATNGTPVGSLGARVDALCFSDSGLDEIPARQSISIVRTSAADMWLFDGPGNFTIQGFYSSASAGCGFVTLPYWHGTIVSPALPLRVTT